MRLKSLAMGLSLVATLALVAGCGGSDDKAKVRLLNASIGSTSLDLAVGDDETVVTSGLAYATVGDYENVDPSDSLLEIQNSTSGATLVSTTPTLSTSDKYTLIAYGVSGSVKSALITETEDTPDSGKSKLQILNLAPDAGSLDVYETATTDTTLADAATLASSISSGSGSGYLSIKSGTYRLVITAAGETSDVRLEIASITLPDKGVSTLILTGSNGGLLVNGMQLVQKGSLTNLPNSYARVRVVSGLSSGSISTSLGSTQLLSSSTSPAIGAYTKVTAGTTAVSMTVNGASVTVSAPTLVAGYDYTLLVYGDAAAPTATLLTDDNKLPTSSTYAKIRLLNGLSTNTAEMTLYVDYSAKASGVAQGYASTPVQMTATTDSLVTVNSTASSTPLFSQTDTDILAQGVYTVFLLGDGTSASTVSASLVKER
ncbi:DUF4397 domain-containing protein [Roseateles sp. SL47]|jgi:Domain of unknown function (DUF4397)|uniref:DUF4397 domain-containing protein n=1 Tax=Roseateles sp. SL47 TaxID=2995138 RepID=UPI00226DD4CA|nr:DUF4397 domain-containing protein [Roseateles sp. SL47]WAC74259.1 DUF4397 domain-containing protein [Roseateles sp. SL47]